MRTNKDTWYVVANSTLRVDEFSITGLKKVSFQFASALQ